jgi:DNA-binding transcriptional MerR regulator
MDEDTSFLKARNLAERTGLPETDVRRFLRTYSEFFTSMKQGRSRVYPPEAAGLLTQIAELEAVGTTPPTIRGILMGKQGGGEELSDPSTVVPGGFAAAAAGEILTLGALSDIKALQEELGELRGEVASLREQVAGQGQKVIAHQEQIRLLRRSLDDIKTEALALRMEGRGIPIWKRLFR